MWTARSLGLVAVRPLCRLQGTVQAPLLSPHSKAQGRHSWVPSEAPHCRIPKGRERSAEATSEPWSIPPLTLRAVLRGQAVTLEACVPRPPRPAAALQASACVHLLLRAAQAAPTQKEEPDAKGKGKTKASRRCCVPRGDSEQRPCQFSQRGE